MTSEVAPEVNAGPAVAAANAYIIGDSRGTSPVPEPNSGASAMERGLTDIGPAGSTTARACTAGTGSDVLVSPCAIRGLGIVVAVLTGRGFATFRARSWWTPSRFCRHGEF